MPFHHRTRNCNVTQMPTQHQNTKVDAIKFHPKQHNAITSALHHATHRNTNTMPTKKIIPGKPLKEIIRNGIPSCHNVVTLSLHQATTPLWNHAIHHTANYNSTQTHTMPNQSIKRNITSFLIQQKAFLGKKQ